MLGECNIFGAGLAMRGQYPDSELPGDFCSRGETQTSRTPCRLAQDFINTVTYLGNGSLLGSGGSESVLIQGRFEESVSKAGSP